MTATIYDWPTGVYPNTFALTWLDNTVSFESPLSGHTRTETRPGGRWAASLTVGGLHNADQGAVKSVHTIEAFLYRLNGAANRVRLPDFSYERLGPGHGAGLGKVKGASQTGLSLLTDGWSASTTVLYAGDRFTIDEQMLICAADVTSDVGGNATITLAHPIRTPTTDNDTLDVDTPTAVFFLKNKVGFAARPGISKMVMIELEEDIL